MLKRGLLLTSLSFMACSCALLPEPHRIEISQGNIIEQASIDKLKLGMTKEQVKFVMGSPALQDIFHPQRWDYIHYVDRQREETINEQLTLIFKDDLLSQVKSSDFDVSQLQTVPAATPSPAVEALAEAPVTAAPAAIETAVETAAVDTTAATEARNKIAINAVLENWAAAWSGQNTRVYTSYYIDDYSPKSSISHVNWVKQRQTKLTRPQYIEVELSAIELTLLDDNTAQAQFKQSYRSNTYQDKVLKQMSFEKQDKAWKISAEKTLKKF